MDSVNFDPKIMIEKIKLVNRNKIEGFLVLDDNLKTLENYFPVRAYICEFCEDKQEFPTYLHYIDHKKRKHDPKNYPYELCGSVLANQLSLRNHIFDIHKSTPQVCKQCNIILVNKKGLRQHNLYIHKATPQSCDQCDSILSSKKGLQEHLRKVHRAQPQCCEDCGKILSRKDTLYEHIKNVHNSIP